MKLFAAICVVLFCIQHGEPARILAAIPTASYSHQIFFQMFWRELAIRGHDVVVITTHPTYEKLPNFREIDISFAQKMMRGAIESMLTAKSHLSSYIRLSQAYYEMSEKELASPQIQELIKDESQKFDLVMVEYLFPSFYALQHRFNASFIGVTSLGGLDPAHDIMGNPTHAVLYPHLMLPPSKDFKDRVVAFLLNQLINFTKQNIVKKIDYLNAKYFGEDYPSLLELASRVDMLFVNANPMFSEVRPLTPSTINIAGGIHLTPPKPLPAHLQKFLDESSQGVVYFSLGSNFQSKNMTNQTLQIIMDTFSQIPYNVLWKFEADNLAGKPENVKIIKWAPQQDILRHKNIKLFITQSGMQSLEEALFSHVPLVNLPTFGDQFANAAKVAAKELGIEMDFKDLTVKNFKAGILEVITNPKYKENVRKLALQIQDDPMTPLERAVWWTEYVLRHKSGQHLKGPRIPFYQYYYLDVLALLGGIFAVVLLSIFCMCKFAYTYAVNFSQRILIKVKRA